MLTYSATTIYFTFVNGSLGFGAKLFLRCCHVVHDLRVHQHVGVLSVHEVHVTPAFVGHLVDVVDVGKFIDQSQNVLEGNKT